MVADAPGEPDLGRTSVAAASAASPAGVSAGAAASAALWADSTQARWQVGLLLLLLLRLLPQGGAIQSGCSSLRWAVPAAAGGAAAPAAEVAAGRARSGFGRGSGSDAGGLGRPTLPPGRDEADQVQRMVVDLKRAPDVITRFHSGSGGLQVHARTSGKPVGTGQLQATAVHNPQ